MKFTAEHKRKLSEAKKGKRQEHLYTPEVLKKRADSQRGRKRPNAQGEKHFAWKGDKVSYGSLHDWVTRQLGAPNRCEHCGTTEAKKFEWANISHSYKRDISDWVRLCTTCHRAYDYGKICLKK